MVVPRTLALCLLLVVAADAFRPSDASSCNCTQLNRCDICTPTLSSAYCFNQCQWCVVSLSCQQCPMINGSYTCPGDDHCQSTDPVLTSFIGQHQDYKCQAADSGRGSGPIVLDATLTAPGSSYKLWDGSGSGNMTSNGPGIPTAGSSTMSIALSGLNWGEQNTSKTARTIRLCPFTGMHDFSTGQSNPSGPARASCFNCTSLDETSLALSDCGFTGLGLHQQCSKVTCSQVPAGIGSVAVFIDVYGEPPSVVATNQVKIPDAAFYTAYPAVAYAAPKITAVTVPSPGECTLPVPVLFPEKCMAKAGDMMNISVSNLPVNAAVSAAYEAGHPNERAVVVMVGDSECTTLEVNGTEGVVHCKIPLTSGGKGLDLTVTVGGQTDVVPRLFYYPSATVLTVKPTHLPSFGGWVTITGQNFDAFSEGVSTVSLNHSTAGSPLTHCEVSPANWTQSQVICFAPLSGAGSKIVDVAVLLHTNSGDSSNTNQNSSFEYNKCAFNTRGGLCRSDGSQLCDTNFECSAGQVGYNQDCDHVDASCKCVDICQNGAFLEPDSCTCSCVNGYSSTSGGGTIPDTKPVGHYSSVCDACTTSCSGLDKKVQNASTCGCEFNKMHLIWIILLIVLVLALIAYVVYRRRSTDMADRDTKALLYAGDDVENNPVDAGQGSSSQGGASYM